jgi:hypothetical protein
VKRRANERQQRRQLVAERHLCDVEQLARLAERYQGRPEAEALRRALDRQERRRA